MNLTSIAGVDALDARAKVARSVYERISPPERTLIARLMVRSLVEECSAAFGRNEAPDVRAWMERMLAEPGRAAAASAVVTALEQSAEMLVEAGFPADFVTQLHTFDFTQASLVRDADDRHHARLDEAEGAIAEVLAGLHPHSAEHAQSVAAWCARIARRLGFSEGEISTIRRCGLLHDMHDAVLAENERLAPFAAAVRAFQDVRRGRAGLDKLDGVSAMAVRILEVVHAFSESIAGNGAREPLSPVAAVEELARSERGYDALVVAALQDLLTR